MHAEVCGGTCPGTGLQMRLQRAGGSPTTVNREGPHAFAHSHACYFSLSPACAAQVRRTVRRKSSWSAAARPAHASSCMRLAWQRPRNCVRNGTAVWKRTPRRQTSSTTIGGCGSKLKVTSLKRSCRLLKLPSITATRLSKSFTKCCRSTDRRAVWIASCKTSRLRSA